MNDAEFEKSLVDGSQVVSVLLVFLSVLFGINYTRVTDALQPAIPNAALPNERKRFRESQRRCVVRNVLPFAVPSLFLAILLGPAFFRIVLTSKIAFPDFNLIRTLFCAIEESLMSAIIWCIVVMWQLLRRQWRAR
jgi:hypothetical protein